MPKNTLIFLSALILSTQSLAQSMTVKLSSGRHEIITVETIEGQFITEGDIVIQNPGTKGMGAVVIPEISGTRWPKGVVAFAIDEVMPATNRENIYRAMLEIAYHAPLHFVEITKTRPFDDFLYFTPADTICSSPVGRQGGKQVIKLAPRCEKGSTMHEILHSLGFWHEQSRADRDSYVRIAWDNIRDNKQYNFNQHLNDGEDIKSYDYQSIMHYGTKAFSKNGRDTIIPLDSNAKIGQRESLSQLDISALNALYHNP